MTVTPPPVVLIPGPPVHEAVWRSVAAGRWVRAAFVEFRGVLVVVELRLGLSALLPWRAAAARREAARAVRSIMPGAWVRAEVRR